MSLMKVVLGDITTLQCDAIVNAANERMLGGGGVDGAIHKAAGQELFNECLKIDEVRPGVRCPTGEARITKAGRLPCSHVIHTAGPVWQGGQRDEAELLANCYRNALRIAVWNGVTRIAFPSISTGVYGYPAEVAAKIAIDTVGEFLKSHNGLVVIFCMFNGPRDKIDMKALYDRLLADYYSDDERERRDRREDYVRAVGAGLEFTHFHGEQDCPFDRDNARALFWEYEAQLASLTHNAESVKDESVRLIEMIPRLGKYFLDEIDVSDVAKAVAIWVGFAHDEDKGYGPFDPGRGFSAYFHPERLW